MESKNMKLTERDIRILYAIYTHRVLTTEQIERLIFYTLKESGRKSACQRRLRKLHHNGYVARDEFETKSSDPTRPFLYLLDEAGYEVLLANFPDEEIRWEKKDNNRTNMFFVHQEKVNDVRIAFELACIHYDGLTLATWKNQRELGSIFGKARAVVENSAGEFEERKIKPDGYFRVQKGDSNFKAAFFIEADRGTETGKKKERRGTDLDPRVKKHLRDNDVATKLKIYEDLSKRGEIMSLFGQEKFRVLVITNSKERAINLRNKAMELDLEPDPELGGKYYFTTFEELSTENLFEAPIWHVSDEDYVPEEPEGLLKPVVVPLPGSIN